MAITLDNLQPEKAVYKKKKRVGRGNASGHGSYSTRGVKGQKARSGVSGLKRLGMKQMLLSVPKVRGFKSYKAKYQAVNLDSINKAFKDGQTVTPATLERAGLANQVERGVKILGRGELTVKNLIFKDVLISESAKEAIVKAGGKMI